MIVEMSIEKIQEDLESVLQLIEIDQAVIKITMDGEIVAIMVPPSMMEIAGKDVDEWLAESEEDEEDDE